MIGYINDQAIDRYFMDGDTLVLVLKDSSRIGVPIEHKQDMYHNVGSDIDQLSDSEWKELVEVGLA